MPIRIKESHIKANISEENQPNSQEAISNETSSTKLSKKLLYHLKKQQWKTLKAREER